MEKELYRYISQDIINRHHYNSVKNIGCLSELINECKPETLDEWIDYYNLYLIESGKNIIIRNNIKYILENYTMLNECDVKEVYKQRLYRDTFDGYEREQHIKYAIENYSKYKLKLIKSNGYTDRDFSVDFFAIDRKENIICCIQCKPISYILSKNYYCIRDRENNRIKYKKFKEIYNIDVIEIYYDNNEVLNLNDIDKYLILKEDYNYEQ